PPGLAAFALTHGLAGDSSNYLLPLLTLSAYTFLLVALTFWMAQRVVLGEGGGQRKTTTVDRDSAKPSYTGWRLPLLSPQIAAVVEKELRYILRNAQVRIMAIMPLILILVRLANTNRFGIYRERTSNPFIREFLAYGGGLMSTVGILYVFLILSGL